MCLKLTIYLHSQTYIKVKTKGRCTKPLIIHTHTHTHTHRIDAMTNPHTTNEFYITIELISQNAIQNGEKNIIEFH